MHRPCGHLPDPELYARGKDLGMLVGGSSRTLPPAYSLRHYAPAGYDQRGNSCLGAAFRHGLMLAARVAGFAIDPSALAIYAGARMLETPGAPRLEDGGAYPYQALAWLTTWGIVDRARWSDDQPLHMPLAIDALEAGSKAVVTGTFRIRDLGNELRKLRIREALAFKDSGVVFGMPIGPAYMRGGVGRYKGEAVEAGGHAQLIVGYDEAGFMVLNSWGAAWNGDGYAWLDADFVAERGFDFTVVTLSPPEVC